MGFVVDRIRAALPDSLGQRIRGLFAAFVVLVAGLSALGLVSADVDRWPDAALALLGLAVVAGWAVVQYRRDGLAPWTDPVPMLAILVTGWALGNPGYVFGLTFVLLYARALYGSARRVWVNAAGYFVAYETAEALTAGREAVLDVGTLTVGLGILFSTGVMWLLGDVIRSSERDARRGAVLAAAASRLQRAETHEQVHGVAVEAALVLAGGGEDVTVALSRGDRLSLRTEARGGPQVAGAPEDVEVDRVPSAVRERLLAGEPFLLGRDATIELQHALGMEPQLRSSVIAPLSDGPDFSGVLSVSSRRQLPEDLLAPVARLAADVGLALDRADSTLLLQQVVDNSSDAILLVDDDLTIDFASSAAGTVLGEEPEALVGRQLRELFAGDAADLRGALEGAERASARRDPEVHSMRHRDGDVRQIELGAMHLPEGRRRGWVINLRDVTQRMRAERELRDSRQRFRSLAETVGEGLYRMSLRPDARFEYVNPAMEQMTGFPAERFVEDPELTLRQVHRDDEELVRRTRTDAGGDIPWPAEVRWRHPQRGLRWLSFRETIVYDDDGRPLESMGIVSDITARKQQEEALHRALEKERRVTEELRRIDAMRTTFLQAVSHELRTPLTVILGYAQTLNRSGDRLDGDRREHMYDRLEANATKLDRLLSDLLDVDRLSSGTIHAVRQPVDVTDLCRRVLEQTPTPSHPVVCVGGPVVAELDAAKVERIIVNLVGNAMKHTPAGTPITVEVTPDGVGDGAVITVGDEGPGVPPELRETIFEPFVQGPESSVAPQPGTGIGLSLVARFAELHGGEAWLEHPREGGSRFCVRLPGPSVGTDRPVPWSSAPAPLDPSSIDPAPIRDVM